MGAHGTAECGLKSSSALTASKSPPWFVIYRMRPQQFTPGQELGSIVATLPYGIWFVEVHTVWQGRVPLEIRVGGWGDSEHPHGERRGNRRGKDTFGLEHYKNKGTEFENFV